LFGKRKYPINIILFRRRGLNMKNYIHKGISLILVVTMSAWCFTGCGTTSESSSTSTKENTAAQNENSESSSTSTMEALLTSKVGSGADTNKNETVYVEMKADGTVTKTTVSDVLKVSGTDNISDVSSLENIVNLSGDESFTKDENGNLIWENKGENISYQGTTTESAPIDIKITYYLDDKEIKAEDLAGKSGKVKIVYDYTNNAKDDDGNFIPFLVLTGMVMDGEHFSNIEIDNGKVINNDDTDIVIGYAAPGFKDELMNSIDNADKYIGDIDIPEAITVTADVTDFTLDMTLTAATSQIGDLDLEDTLDFSDIESQMDELQNGTDELVDGTKQLNDGAAELKAGSEKINSGAGDLSKYTIQLADGTGELNNKYTIFNKALLNGVKSASSGAKKVYKGTKELESGAEAVNSGSKELESAATAIYNGSEELESGAAAADSGAKELESAAIAVNEGSKQVADGISQVKTAFEDTTNEDGSVKAQGIENGAKSVAAGVKSANAGVKELAGTVQGMPSSIEQQIQQIINNVSTATGGMISSEQALNATVEGINTAVTSGMELSTVLSSKGLDASSYYSLVQAYYSVQTLETVKDTFTAQIQSKATDIKELLDGMNTLESGSSALSGGIQQVYNGIKQLDSGAKSLSSGTEAMEKGMKSLTLGTAGLKSGTSKIATATSKMKDGTSTLSTGTASLKTGASKLTKGMKQLSTGASTLNTKLGDASPQIQSGISKIDTAAKKISEGAKTLSSGTTELDNGIVTLADGTKELEDGAIKLNEEGIQKITEIFGKDAQDAVDKIEDTLNAGKEYKSFSGINKDMSGEVKFIFKTEEIKAESK
jgi:putative membrane protein